MDTERQARGGHGRKTALNEMVGINAVGLESTGRAWEKRPQREGERGPKERPGRRVHSTNTGDCDREGEKVPCTLSGFLFPAGTRDPARNRRNIADPTVTRVPGH